MASPIASRVRPAPSTPATAPDARRQRLETPPAVRRAKEVRCSVHGSITLDPLLVAIMDTETFQRLRRTRQLGVSDHVYPTATHSRFEHSLGVAHLAGLLCQKLRSHPFPKGADPPSDRDILCVQLAGLCHDLGHGPYSHTFEKIVPGFKHAKMSNVLLDKLFQSEVRLSDFAAGGERLNEEVDLTFIKELIDGGEKTARGRRKWYLYDIVANDRFGLDVDRLDYLMRDSKNAIGECGCGFTLGFILDNARVRMTAGDAGDDDDAAVPVIAFPRKAASELWKVFRARHDMFNQVYLHPKCIGRELLLQDVLQAMGELPAPYCHVLPGKKLADAASEPGDFIRLDDHILSRLRQRLDELMDSDELTMDPPDAATTRGSRPEVRAAADALGRFLRHDHYAKLAEELWDEEMGPIPKARALQENWGLPAEQFHVVLRSVHHGDGSRNPMEACQFFNPKLEEVDELATPLPQPEKWLPLPRHFARTTVCVYWRGEAKDASGRTSPARRDAEQRIRDAWQAHGFPSPSDVDEEPPLSQGYS